MALVVTGVGFLIHVYSIGYMEHEPRYQRFFFYLNFFILAMLVLVMSNNFLWPCLSAGKAWAWPRTC